MEKPSTPPIPSRLPRPGRPSLYPDTSTLADAFQGREANDARRDLFTLIEETARTANLCLSWLHLLELLQLPHQVERRQRAEWLDGLDIVWLRDVDEVQEAELSRYLSMEAGIRVEPLGLPFAPSFLWTFRGWKPEQTPEVLGRGIAGFVKECGAPEDVEKLLGKFRESSRNATKELFADRKLAERNGFSGEKLHDDLKAKLDRRLAESAVAVGKKLGADEKSGYVAPSSGGVLVPRGDDFARSVMRPLDEIRHDLPYEFVFHETIRRVGDYVGGKKSVDSKFFRLGARDGDFGDWWHLIGAAYCDVFTCDGDTSTFMGDVRARLGRSKEVVFRKNDWGTFAEDLRRALDDSRALYP